MKRGIKFSLGIAGLLALATSLVGLGATLGLKLGWFEYLGLPGAMFSWYIWGDAQSHPVASVIILSIVFNAVFGFVFGAVIYACYSCVRLAVKS